MHSFLITSSDLSFLEKHVEKICTDYHIHIFDQKRFTPEKTIGIADVRKLQENLFLSPVQSALKALIVYHTETMSTAAQNALLKTLEEPPHKTIIILTASTKEAFLPTILSRCTLIEDTCVSKELDPKLYETYKHFFEHLPKSTPAEQLLFAQNTTKTKEDALIWLENAICFLREMILTTKGSYQINTIKKLQQTHSLLSKTNANPRLTMEHLFIDAVCTS